MGYDQMMKRDAQELAGLKSRCPEPCPINPIPMTINKLDENIDRLTNTARILNDKLISVLRQDPPSPETAKNIIPTYAIPLADKLEQINYSLERSLSDLTEIIDRIGL